MRTSPFISSQKSRATRRYGLSSGGLMRVAPRAAGSVSATMRGSESACCTRASSLTAMPTVSTSGRAFRRSMSALSARRRLATCSLSARASRWSAAWSAMSAPFTLPASCSCWLARMRSCSTSASMRSSALLESSRYMSSTATRFSCASATRDSSSAMRACDSLSATCACASAVRDCATSVPRSASRPPAVCDSDENDWCAFQARADRHHGRDERDGRRPARAACRRPRRRGARISAGAAWSVRVAGNS